MVRFTVAEYIFPAEPKSLAKSAGNTFPAEFTQTSAGKSAGKAKNSNNGRACYKESWRLAQASGGWLRPSQQRDNVISALFRAPKKGSQGIINTFKVFDILNPEELWISDFIRVHLSLELHLALKCIMKFK
ncbi:hypothetical protein MTR_6g044880 [Medicago truncatula]|uniref:Uncharacterized protein n=1 Tax=Medicago truncatula TaxID=3880 RepID=G7KJK7_MEDTR|nr:hypothetical protein MTR_6g044880 [Medicago truncatula]